MAVIAVPYILINVRSHPGPVVAAANNFTYLILIGVYYRDLAIGFTN